VANVDPDTVRHVARLAKLEIEEDRIDDLTRELAAILEHVEQISAFETGQGTEARRFQHTFDPSTGQTDPSQGGTVLPRRADEPHEPGGTALLAHSAETRDDEVCVPSVLGEAT